MSKILLIIFLQLLYMPFLTIRTDFMVKNKCKYSAIFGVMEALVYIFGLSLVLSGENNVYTMLAYAGGFGLGILLGGCIEEKIKLGDITVTVNIKNKNEQLINALRKSGFRFSIFEGVGVDGKRYKFDILTCKRREKDLIDIIDTYEPHSFVILNEPHKYKTRKSLELK